MKLKKERILVLFALVALVNCYNEQHSNDYESESVSHIDLENENDPDKFSAEDSQPRKREVVRHERRKQMPKEDRNWQVKPVKKVSKKAKKIHIYLNDEPKVVPKPRKQPTRQPETVDNSDHETQTKRTPELTTRADSDINYFRFTDKDSVPAGSTFVKHSTKGKEAHSADSQVEGTEHHEHVKEKIKIKHHHHHHHHSHIKTVVKKEPYPVEKIVHVPVEKVVEKVVTVEKKVPYKVEVPVEKIVHVPFEKIVEKFVKVPYDRPYPVEKIVEKKVPYAVKEYVTVPVDRPYPVEKVVEKFIKVPTPYPVEKKVHVPQPYPVPVEKIIETRIPYPVVKEVEVPRPFPVVQIKEVKVPYPVEKIVEKKIPHPYPVIKEVKVPVYIQTHQKHQSQNNHQQNNHQQNNQQQANHQQNNHHGQHGQQNQGQNHGHHEYQLNSQQLNSHYDSFVSHPHHQHQHQQNFDDSFFAGSKKYEKVQNSKHQQPRGNHDYQTTPPNQQIQDSYRRTLKVPPKSQRQNPAENHSNTVTQSPQIKNVHTPLPQIIVGQQPKGEEVQHPLKFHNPNKLPVDLQTPQTPVGFKTQQAQQEQKNSDNFYKFDNEYPSQTPNPQPDLITEGSTRYETYSQAPQPHVVFVHSQPQFYAQMQQNYDHTQQAYIAQELMHQEQQQLQFDERRHQFDQKRLQYEEALRQHEQQLRNHEQIQQGLGDPQYQIQYPINVQYAYQPQQLAPVQENPSENNNFQPSYGVAQK